MNKDLRSCIELLKSADRLITIKKHADPRFEVPAIMKAAEREQKAVLLENVSKPPFRIIANVLSSREILALLFETSRENVVSEWVKRTRSPIPPELVSEGPVKEVVYRGGNVDLNNLPIVTHCSKDAGPFITAGVVVAKDPDTGIRNLSVNRMQLKGRNKLGIRMMPPQHLGLIHEKYEKKGENLKVAVAIGVHPFELMAATTTVAHGFDELGIAGSLNKAPVQLVKCETVDLEVPAAAEIILEGEVLAGVREPEGPFGDFMQYYVPVMDNHVLRVNAITHRKDPIYQTIQASSMEDTYLLALSREAKIYEAVSQVAAAVHAISLAPTILACAISIQKRFEGEPKNVASAAFGVYPWLKYCVVVDHDVDVFDMNDVWWAMATRSRPDRGLLLISHALGFPRDPFGLHQSKLGIDATAPLNRWEEFGRKTVPGADLVHLADYR